MKTGAAPKGLRACGFVLLAVLGVSCGGLPSELPSLPPTRVGITTIPCSQGSNPPRVFVPVRRQCQLGATAWNGNGQIVEFAAFSWSIDREDLATVDQLGEVTGVAVGTTRVRVEVLGLPTVFTELPVEVLPPSPTGSRTP